MSDQDLKRVKRTHSDLSTPSLTNTITSESSTSSQNRSFRQFGSSGSHARASTDPVSIGSLTGRAFHPCPKSPQSGHSRTVSTGDSGQRYRSVSSPTASQNRPSSRDLRSYTSPIHPGNNGKCPEPSRHNNDHRRYSGTVNQYGRHTNDWLFGGFSFRDTFRDGLDKFRHHDPKSG
jgi:hypothetical protein